MNYERGSHARTRRLQTRFFIVSGEPRSCCLLGIMKSGKGAKWQSGKVAKVQSGKVAK